MGSAPTIGALGALFADSEELKKRAVFAKGLIVFDRAIELDPNEWRYDVDFNLIRYSEYGLTTAHGWEIDHAYPSALGGGDHFANLRPLHWKSNRSRGAVLAALLKK